MFFSPCLGISEVQLFFIYRYGKVQSKSAWGYEFPTRTLNCRLCVHYFNMKSICSSFNRHLPFSFWFCCKTNTREMKPLDRTLHQFEKSFKFEIQDLIFLYQISILCLVPLDYHNQSFHHKTPGNECEEIQT